VCSVVWQYDCKWLTYGLTGTVVAMCVLCSMVSICVCMCVWLTHGLTGTVVAMCVLCCVLV